MGSLMNDLFSSMSAAEKMVSDAGGGELLKGLGGMIKDVGGADGVKNMIGGIIQDAGGADGVKNMIGGIIKDAGGADGVKNMIGDIGGMLGSGGNQGGGGGRGGGGGSKGRLALLSGMLGMGNIDFDSTAS